MRQRAVAWYLGTVGSRIHLVLSGATRLRSADTDGACAVDANSTISERIRLTRSEPLYVIGAEGMLHNSSLFTIATLNLPLDQFIGEPSSAPRWAIHGRIAVTGTEADPPTVVRRG